MNANEVSCLMSSQFINATSTLIAQTNLSPIIAWNTWGQPYKWQIHTLNIIRILLLKFRQTNCELFHLCNGIWCHIKLHFSMCPKFISKIVNGSSWSWLMAKCGLNSIVLLLMINLIMCILLNCALLTWRMMTRSID